MPDVNDMELLRDYGRQGSEEAFAELVGRHINLVYSVAIRHVGIAAQAEEITQAVFIILSRKAANLRPDTVLEGWLHETTRLTALSFLRGERRRQLREQEAYMQSTLQDSADVLAWNQLAPLLDEAMSRLGKKDRDAVLLRFFKEKNVREVAVALRVNEAAAQKRILRALDKLRKFFTKRGVSSTTAIIAGAISAHSVQAAPVALAKSVTTVAIAKGVMASGSTLTLVKGVLKLMAWTKAKSVIAIGAGVLLAVGTTAVAVHRMSAPAARQSESGTSIWQVENILDDRITLERIPPMVKIVPTKFVNGVGMRSAARAGKLVGLNQPLEDILRVAYGSIEAAHEPGRLIFETELPKECYDYIASQPQGSAQALQKEIKTKFGIVARSENRETDVLLLRVKNPNAPGLKLSGQSPAAGASTRGAAGGRTWSNVTTGELIYFLEHSLKVPIMDQTGLKQSYDIELKWAAVPIDPNQGALKKAVLDQLGLELLPATKSIEMLVIAKAKN